MINCPSIADLMLLLEEEGPEQPPNRVFTSSISVAIRVSIIPHSSVEVPVIISVIIIIIIISVIVSIVISIVSIISCAVYIIHILVVYAVIPGAVVNLRNIFVISIHIYTPSYKNYILQYMFWMKHCYYISREIKRE